MDKQFSFTRSRIDKLPVPETGKVDYQDQEQPKLFCRVSASGNKSFLVRKRVNGKLRNITIGKTSDWTVKDTRNEAQNILLKLSQNQDPILAKKQARTKEITLKQLLERYLDERSLSEYTVYDYRYKTNKYLEDWLDKPVITLTRNDVEMKFKDITKVGKTTANGTMRVFRLLMKYAVATEIISNSPIDVAKEARLWHKNERCKRLISSKELPSWLRAVHELDNIKAKVYLLMLLYMGVRKRSALELMWSDVDLDEKTATFDTKSNKGVVLPIPDVLLPEMQKLKKQTGNRMWVFPSDKTTLHMWEPKRDIQRVIKQTGVKFSSHDCRRTFATIAEACRLPTTLLKRMLDHATESDVTGGYVLTEDDTLRVGFNDVSTYILKQCAQ